MRERVGALVGPVVKAMWVSTFHSACVRILRRDGEALGYPRNFSIYDQADAVRLTGYVIRDLGLDAKRFTPRGVHGSISLWKNELVEPGTGGHERPRTSSIASTPTCTPSTRPASSKAGAMDFDDLLLNVVRLFREHPDVLEHYRRALPSTSSSTSTRTRTRPRTRSCCMLAGGHQNVCVVGDTDQIGVQVPRCRLPQHHAVRGRVPRRHHDRARPELPVDADHPRRRQRGDRQQRRAQTEEPLDRHGRRRPHHPLPRRGRGRRGDVGRRNDAATPPRRGDELARDGGPVPHQRPEPRDRGGVHAPRRARTRWSAAPASTTGARSRTRWRTCVPSSTRSTR